MATFHSASAIVGGAVATGHYLLQVDGYSRTRVLPLNPIARYLKHCSRTKELPIGHCIIYPAFKIGDCSWRIYYYPNGTRRCYADYISIFVALDGVAAEPVRIKPRFTLLDQAGEPVPGRSLCGDSIVYSTVNVSCGFHGFIKREIPEKSGHLVDDCFTISCDVSVCREFHTEDRPTPLSGLQRHLRDLLEAKESADVTFQVEGEMISAHRCILAARSPVFKELLVAQREGAAGIRIDDMEAQVFKALLHFMYTDALPMMTRLEEATMAEQLLLAADRYDIQKLKLICEEKLSRDIDVNTVAKRLELAVQHRCDMLKEACVAFLKYPSALEVVVATNDGFDNVVTSCPTLLKELWTDWFEGDPSIQNELLTW
ncbi:hypothetical protein ACP70R_019403 [Stipagrostis hirtigluma subsp. patula]